MQVQVKSKDFFIEEKVIVKPRIKKTQKQTKNYENKS